MASSNIAPIYHPNNQHRNKLKISQGVENGILVQSTNGMNFHNLPSLIS
jgi:hypothetical protein